MSLTYMYTYTCAMGVCTAPAVGVSKATGEQERGPGRGWPQRLGLVWRQM